MAALKCSGTVHKHPVPERQLLLEKNMAGRASHSCKTGVTRRVCHMDMMLDMFDESPLVFEFLNTDAAFRGALEQAFPDEDIVARSSFSGTEVLSIVVRLSRDFLARLSAFLVAEKRAESARRVKVQIGKNVIELSGYGSEDVKQMEDTLLQLVREARGP